MKGQQKKINVFCPEKKKKDEPGRVAHTYNLGLGYRGQNKNLRFKTCHSLDYDEARFSQNKSQTDEKVSSFYAVASICSANCHRQ